MCHGHRPSSRTAPDTTLETAGYLDSGTADRPGRQCHHPDRGQEGSRRPGLRWTAWTPVQVRESRAAKTWLPTRKSHGVSRCRRPAESTWVMSFAAVNAQLLYTAPSHLACTIRGDRQYGRWGGSVRRWKRACTPAERPCAACQGRFEGRQGQTCLVFFNRGAVFECIVEPSLLSSQP
jgi:hypothetical protein